MTERGQRKSRSGVVIRKSSDKTVMVNVERHKMQSLYHRLVKKTKHYMVHDEKNECHIGDVVEIMETRPLSKRKRWRILNVLKKSE
jgi:small subunit ribosomal protein S17